MRTVDYCKQINFAGIPETAKPERVFRDYSDYRRFADGFHKEMAPAIKEQAENRRKSEATAQRHFVN